jgi:hypothetical protein
MPPRTGRPIGKKPSIKSRFELPLISKVFARAIGLLKSTHPIPSFAVTSFTVLLAIGYGMPLEKLVLVGLGILFQQFSVGLSNDWLDYERDKIVGRNDKPTVRFEVSAKLVRNASLVSAVIALAISNKPWLGSFADHGHHADSWLVIQSWTKVKRTIRVAIRGWFWDSPSICDLVAFDPAASDVVGHACGRSIGRCGSLRKCLA